MAKGELTIFNFWFSFIEVMLVILDLITAFITNTGKNCYFNVFKSVMRIRILEGHLTPDPDPHGRSLEPGSGSPWKMRIRIQEV